MESGTIAFLNSLCLESSSLALSSCSLSSQLRSPILDARKGENKNLKIKFFLLDLAFCKMRIMMK